MWGEAILVLFVGALGWIFISWGRLGWRFGMVFGGGVLGVGAFGGGLWKIGFILVLRAILILVFRAFLIFVIFWLFIP